MVSFVYIVSTCISFIVLIYVMSKSRFQNIYFMLMQLLTLMSNMGYVAFSLSKVVEEAILAVKIYYVGGTYLNLFVFFIICDICNLKVPRWLSALLVTFSTVVYGLVWTIGYSTVYYKEVTLYFYEGIPKLAKVYGPMHNAYSFLLYGLAVANIAALIISVVKSKEVSKSAVFTLGAMEAVTMAIYIAQRAMDIPFDLMPVCYIFIVVTCATLVDRQAYFDVTINQMRKVAEEGSSYIFFDKYMRLMAYDEGAVMVFASLKENHIGEKITVMNGDLEHQLMAWVTESSKSAEIIEPIQKVSRGVTYEFDLRPLRDGMGYCLKVCQIQKEDSPEGN